MADGRHLEKSKNVVSMDIINSLLKTGTKTAARADFGPTIRRSEILGQNVKRYNNFVKFFVCSFIRSLRAGVRSTLDPSDEIFISVQCPRPGRGGELVGVCGVCASCVGWRKEQ